MVSGLLAPGISSHRAEGLTCRALAPRCPCWSVGRDTSKVFVVRPAVVDVLPPRSKVSHIEDDDLGRTGQFLLDVGDGQVGDRRVVGIEVGKQLRELRRRRRLARRTTEIEEGDVAQREGVADGRTGGRRSGRTPTGSSPVNPRR